ncbi:MAG: hypothetical protein LBN09_04485 [Clostridioides sp.]|nr:hypothetical protein [Clostridioides sp.]
MGYNNSLAFDGSSFLIGAIIYLLAIKDVKILKPNVKNTDDRHGGTLKSNKQFKSLCVLYIVVALITNLEEPIIFNYLSIERHFSQNTIGVALSLFSLGMFIGSFLIKYIDFKSTGVFSKFMILDGVFSILLSLNISKFLIVVFYFVQGVFAMLMIIFFKIYAQSQYEDAVEFAIFNNEFSKKTSIASILSYTLAILLSISLKESSLIFKAMGGIEILVAMIYLCKF